MAGTRISIIGEWIVNSLLRWRTVFSHSDKFSDGKLNLSLSLRHDASATVLDQWKQSFIQASKLLFHATNGQLQFGTIRVANNSRGSIGADAFLFECSGRSFTGRVMRLCGDEKFRPYIIVHELGHFAFQLADEHKNMSGGVAFCSHDPLTQRCIMEHPAEFGDLIDPMTGLLSSGVVNEFCDEDNHDATSGNVQEQRNGHSCWQTIVETPPFVDLVIPSSQRTYSDVGHEAVIWEELLPHQRFLFVLNLTAAESAKVADGIVDALATWAEYCRSTEESMGLINSAGQILFDLEPIDTDEKLARLQTQIATINAPSIDMPAAKSNAIADQAEFCFSKLRPSTNQALVWITDNQVNEESLHQLTAKLRRLKVRAFPVLISDRPQDLYSLAHDTGGAAQYLPSTFERLDAVFALQTVLMSLSADLIENTGFIAYEEIVWPPMSAGSQIKSKLIGLDTDDLKMKQVGELPFDRGRDMPFNIEKSCQRIMLTLISQIPSSVELWLISPTGDTFSADLEEIHGRRSMMWRISNPQPGVWTVRVFRKTVVQIKVTLSVIAENKDLHVALDYTVDNDSKAVGLKGYAEFDRPVNNLIPTATISSSDSSSPLASESRNLLAVSQVVPEKLVPAEWAAGAYVGQFAVDRPGVYNLVAKFRNIGTAYRSSDCECDTSLTANLLPPFERIVRRQVVVK